MIFHYKPSISPPAQLFIQYEYMTRVLSMRGMHDFQNVIDFSTKWSRWYWTSESFHFHNPQSSIHFQTWSSTPSSQWNKDCGIVESGGGRRSNIKSLPSPLSPSQHRFSQEWSETATRYLLTLRMQYHPQFELTATSRWSPGIDRRRPLDRRP